MDTITTKGKNGDVSMLMLENNVIYNARGIYRLEQIMIDINWNKINFTVKTAK